MPQSKQIIAPPRPYGRKSSSRLPHEEHLPSPGLISLAIRPPYVDMRSRSSVTRCKPMSSSITCVTRYKRSVIESAGELIW